ncbi:MAG: citrate/2-methylcitrate synthase [Clostridia bacterium]|nr:citrate/2-methylcitrate synthase [Clostridia bacterium]
MGVLDKLCLLAEKNNKIESELYIKHNVKRGLRNSDSTGVLVGLTDIGDVHGYVIDEGEKVPVEGRLKYRGINVKELVEGFQQEKRFGYEEACYLLLFGELPNKTELKQFCDLLSENRKLPEGFVEDMILKAPSMNIMNKLARSVLTYYSYDDNPDDISLKNMLKQSIKLIAVFPTIVAYSYQAKCHYFDNKSLYIHIPDPNLCTAENFLYMIRPDNKYTRLEAELLDLNLVLHAEHGGGNNSAFTTRVVSSSGTDTYSAIAAAVGSLKGPRHGGANMKVMEMMEDIKSNVDDWADEQKLEDYLLKILNKEAFDRSGLIYGMGHAVYTLSDPRARLLKQKAEELAKEKGMDKEFLLYTNIEKLASKVFSKFRGKEHIIKPNVDFYSGFVYDMLNIPLELYTPIFAISRIVGWCAHRIEEVISGGKIIRPAYKNVSGKNKYVPLNERE